MPPSTSGMLTMKIEIGDASALPEHLRPLAATAEGKTILDLTTLAPVAEVERFKAKAQTAEGEAIERRRALKAYEAFGTVEELGARLAKGADPAIIDQLRAQIATTEKASGERVSRVLRDAAQAGLKAELLAAGVIPEALDMLAAFVAPRLTHDDNDALRILAEDGKSPMLGSGPNGGATLKDFAAALAKAMPHFIRDQGRGGGGKETGVSTAGAKTISRAAFEKLDAATRAARMKDGFSVTD